jgi:hypothetical protein
MRAQAEQKRAQRSAVSKEGPPAKEQEEQDEAMEGPPAKEQEADKEQEEAMEKAALFKSPLTTDVKIAGH